MKNLHLLRDIGNIYRYRYMYNFIAQPWLIRPSGYKTFYEIFLFVVAMIGIGYIARFGGLPNNMFLLSIFKKASRSGIQSLLNMSQSMSHSLYPLMAGSMLRISSTVARYRILCGFFHHHDSLAYLQYRFASGFNVQTLKLAKSCFCLALDFS